MPSGAAGDSPWSLPGPAPRTSVDTGWTAVPLAPATVSSNLGPPDFPDRVISRDGGFSTATGVPTAPDLWAFDDTSIDDPSWPGCFIADGEASTAPISAGHAPTLDEDFQPAPVDPVNYSGCTGPSGADPAVPYQVLPRPLSFTCADPPGPAGFGESWTDGLADTGGTVPLVVLSYESLCFDASPEQFYGSYVTAYAVTAAGLQRIRPEQSLEADLDTSVPGGPAGCDAPAGYQSPVVYDGYVYLYDVGGGGIPRVTARCWPGPPWPGWGSCCRPTTGT